MIRVILVPAALLIEPFSFRQAALLPFACCHGDGLGEGGAPSSRSPQAPSLPPQPLNRHTRPGPVWIGQNTSASLQIAWT